MLVKELSYPVVRFLSPYLGEPQQALEGRLTLTFYLKPAAHADGDVLSRYNRFSQLCHRSIEPLVWRRLLLGPDEQSHEGRATSHFPVAPDCGTLGTYLLREMFAQFARELGFGIEKLQVTFGVFEKATCFPRREPAIDYVYQAKPDREPKESEI